MGLGWWAGEAQVLGHAQSDKDLPLLHPYWPKGERCRRCQALRGCLQRYLRWQQVACPRVRPDAAAEAECSAIGKQELSLLDGYSS